jgi:hypothetical protein
MRIARSTGTFSGLLIVLLGIWGGLIPFVGPYFSYSFGSNATWHYTTDRLWLCILPGALAILGGALLVLAATRAAGIFGGWLAVIAGAWYAVGPAVSLTWENGAGPGTGPIGHPMFGATRQMLELVGYFYGLGALIVALAAFSVGRFASRPAIAPEAAVASGAATAGEGPATLRAPARGEGPARRRPRRARGLPFTRRGRAAREEAQVAGR